MLTMLPRVDARYLNCWKSLVVSYLKAKGYPVEWLFYNSYEPTDEMYRQLIVQQKPKWDFASAACSEEDLKQLGVSITHKRYGCFREAEEEVRMHIQSGHPLFVTCDMFELQHKTNHYQQHHVRHLVLVTGYTDTASGGSYRILDDNSSGLGDYYPHDCREEDLARAFDRSDRIITDLELQPVDVRGGHPFAAAFRQNLDAYEVATLFYSYAQSLIERGGEACHGPELHRLISALTIVAGSRAVFLKFLESTSSFPSAQATVAECALQAERLGNALMKASINKRLDVAGLREKCALIRSLDEEALQKMRNYDHVKKG